MTADDAVARPETLVAAETLSAMPAKLREAQKVFTSTGGLHGAGHSMNVYTRPDRIDPHRGMPVTASGNQ